MSEPIDYDDLQRWGNAGRRSGWGQREDGYWTPWHIANDAIIALRSDNDQLREQVEAFRREQIARNKIDPVTRLHNLCDHLAEQRRESPFTAESLELADASYKELCSENSALREQVAAKDALLQYRGFAHLGVGAYLINHSRAGVPAELVISLATEKEKEGRVVGDERDNDPDAEIQPEVMAVRLRFSNVAGLDALEQQLRYLRDVHFTDHTDDRYFGFPPQEKNWTANYQFDKTDDATRLFCAASDWMDRAEAAEADNAALREQNKELARERDQSVYDDWDSVRRENDALREHVVTLRVLVSPAAEQAMRDLKADNAMLNTLRVQLSTDSQMHLDRALSAEADNAALLTKVRQCLTMTRSEAQLLAGEMTEGEWRTVSAILVSRIKVIDALREGKG